MFDLKNINIRLILINLVLLIAVFFLSDPFHLFDTTYEKSPRFFKVKSVSDIQSIKIIQSSNPAIDLHKTENGWSVKSSDQQQDFPASGSKIETALEKLIDMRKYYEITSKTEKYNEFEVNDDALLVEIKHRDKSESIYIGKQGATYNTTLVRMKGDKIVYSVKGVSKSDWNQNQDYFRQKQLLQITKENIQNVVYTGTKNYVLRNSENEKWTINIGANTMNPNPVKINRLLDDISMMEGFEFYYLPQTGFFYGNIDITTKSNISFKIEVNRLGNEYIIKSDQNPFWQKIPEYRIKSIFPEINEIMDNTAR